MQDDFAALFAYDRWANTRVLDACRKLTAEQYIAEPAPGWSSVRSTIDHITLVTELHLRTLVANPADNPTTTTETHLARVDDAARLLECAYRYFEELRPTLTPEWLNTMLTLRGSDPRIGDYAFSLPRWAMLRHIVTHSTYHRGQVASKLKQLGIEQPNTDFFFWAVEQTPETEALRQAYAALNRNDIPAFVQVFDPQIEWTEPAEYPGAGTYRGHAAVKAHLSQMRGLWVEGSCEPRRLIVAGDKVIVFVDVRVRLNNETEWREGHLADVYTFRNGKATHMRAFADRRQALEWAGAKTSDEN